MTGDWPMARAVTAKAGQDYSDYVMLALRPPLDVRQAYAAMPECTEDVDDLHLTLLYLGKIEDVGGEWGRERLYRACYHAALDNRRDLVGTPNGVGWFLNGEENVLVSLWDTPYLSEFRESLVRRCRLHGVPLREENHGFTPHMTLAYREQGGSKIPGLPIGGRDVVKFDAVWLVWGEDWQEIPLT